MRVVAAQSPSWKPELRGVAGFVAAVAVLGAALALVHARLEPPPALGDSAPEDMFSATRAMATLGRLIGDDVPHPVGSAAAVSLRERLVAEFAAIGLAAEVQPGFACGPRSASCGRVWNVVAALPGAREAPALLVSAHHDSVASGPGAGDDGAGVASALEVARALKAGPPLARPVVFVLVDGEEAGLLGAQAFVDAHPLAATIGCAINLDAGGTRGVTSLTRTTADNSGLIATVAGAVPRPHGASVIGAVYGLTPYDTDFTVYKNAGWPVLDFGFGEDKAHYHTPLDRVDRLDPASVQHLGDTALAAIRGLAQADLEAMPASSRVYLDVLGAAMLHWPTLWTPFVALLVLLVLGTRARRLARSCGEATRRVWVRRTAAFPLLVLGPAAVGAVWMVGLAWATGAEVPGHASPLAARVALWTAVLASSGAIAGWLARGDAQARAWLWLGPWLWLAAIGVLTSLALPGASVGVLPPALVAAIVALVVWRKRQVSGDMVERPGSWTVLVSLALPAVMWLQAAVRVEAIFGLGPAAAGVLALLAVLLAPLWLGLARLRRPVVLGLGLASVVAAGVTLGQAPYSAERPRRLSVLYHVDADELAARWIVGADAPLPAEMKRITEFGPAGPAFAWDADDAPSFVAAAAPIEVEPPEVEVDAEAEPAAEGRRIRLRLRSRRGARVAALLLPESAGVRSVTIEGVQLPAYPEHRRKTYRDVEVYGVVALPAEGVTVTVDVDSAAPVEAVVWDLSEGLPAEGAALRAARPPWAVPSHGGDRTMVSRRVTL